MGNIYEDGTYLQNNPEWGAAEAPWKAEVVFKMLSKNGIYPSSVCEVGCGGGGVLKALSSLLSPDVSISGYDISPQAIDICEKKHSNSGIHFYCEDFLSSAREGFDLILCLDVFEHIEDYYSFLRKLKERAHYKIFIVPLDLSVQSILRNNVILWNREKVGHIHYFTKDLALSVLKDTGYDVLDYSYVGSSIDIPTLGWKAKIIKIPRKFLFTINKDVAVRILGGYSLLVLAR